MQWKTYTSQGSREVNEDSVGVFTDGGTTVFIVADGLGGHGKGDIASRIAVETFGKMSRSGLEPRQLLAEGFKETQNAILAEQKRLSSYFQMKTTACALVVSGASLTWGYIGDTRLYAFKKNKVKERTLDHSVPQMLVMAKEIREKDIRHHPDRNKLLRVLGVSGDPPRFDISETYSFGDIDAFLMCTDGFWELIIEKEMCSLLKKTDNAGEWLDRMSAAVNEHGAGTDMDNNSAIAIRM